MVNLFLCVFSTKNIPLTFLSVLRYNLKVKKKTTFVFELKIYNPRVSKTVIKRDLLNLQTCTDLRGVTS